MLGLVAAALTGPARADEAPELRLNRPLTGAAAVVEISGGRPDARLLIDSAGTQSEASMTPGDPLVATIEHPAPFGEQVEFAVGDHVVTVSRSSAPNVASIDLSRSETEVIAQIEHSAGVIRVEVELTVHDTFRLQADGGALAHVAPLARESALVKTALTDSQTQIAARWAGRANADAVALVSVRVVDAFGRDSTVERILFLDNADVQPALQAIKMSPNPLRLGGVFGPRRQVEVVGVRPGGERVDLTTLLPRMRFEAISAGAGADPIVDVDARGFVRALRSGEAPVRVHLNGHVAEVLAVVDDIEDVGIALIEPGEIVGRGTQVQLEAMATTPDPDIPNHHIELGLLPADLVTWAVVGDGLSVSPTGRATALAPSGCDAPAELKVTATFGGGPPAVLPICVRNAEPQLTVDIPAQAAPGAKVSLDARAEDDSAVVHVELLINGALVESRAPDADGEARFELVTPPVAERSIDVVVAAVDDDDARTEIEGVIEVALPRDPLVVPFLDAPTQGQRLVAERPITIDVTAGDWRDEVRDAAIYRRVLFFVDEVPAGVAERAVTHARTLLVDGEEETVLVPVWSLDWTPPRGAIGRTVAVRAVAEGHDGQIVDSPSRLLTIVGDTPPFVRLVRPDTPQLQAIKGQPFALTVRVSDDASRQLRVELKIAEGAGPLIVRDVETVAAEAGVLNALVELNADIAGDQRPGRIVVRVVDDAGLADSITRPLVPIDPPATIIALDTPDRVYKDQPVTIRAISNSQQSFDWTAGPGQLVDGAPAAVVESAPGIASVFQFTPDSAGPWGARAEQTEDGALVAAGAAQIEVLEDDERPTTTIVRPTAGASATPGEAVVVVVSAIDSHPVEEIAVEWTITHDAEEPTTSSDSFEPLRVVRPGAAVEHIARLLIPTAEGDERVSIKARARDGIGWSDWTAPRIVSLSAVDEPIVELVSPAEGARWRAGEVVTIRAQARRGDDVLLAGIDPADNEALQGEWTVGTYTVPDEDDVNTVDVRAFVGDTEVRRTVPVDPARAPSIAVIRPVDGESVPTGDVVVEIAVSGTDQTPTLDPGGVAFQAGAQPGRWIRTITINDEGPLDLGASVDGPDGAAGVAAEWQVILAEDVPPTVEIDSPAAGTRHAQGALVSLLVRANDPEGRLASVRACGDPTEHPWGGGDLMVVDCRIPAPDASNEALLTATVTATVPNAAPQSTTANVQIEVDADEAPPAVEWITRPPASVEIGSQFTIEWEATDLVSLGAASAAGAVVEPVGEEVVLERQVENPLAPGMITTWQARRQRYRARIEALEGDAATLNVEVTVSDQAGNTSALDAVVALREVANRRPTVSLSPVDPSFACIAGAELMVRLEARDDRGLAAVSLRQHLPEGDDIAVPGFAAPAPEDPPVPALDTTISLTVPPLEDVPLGGLWWALEAEVADDADPALSARDSFHCEVQADEPPTVSVEAPEQLERGHDAAIQVVAEDDAGLRLIGWLVTETDADVDPTGWLGPDVAESLTIPLAGEIALHIEAAPGATRYRPVLDPAAADALPAGLSVTTVVEGGFTRATLADTNAGQTLARWALAQLQGRAGTRSLAAQVDDTWSDTIALHGLAIDTSGQRATVSQQLPVVDDVTGPVLSVNAPDQVVAGQPLTVSVTGLDAGGGAVTICLEDPAGCLDPGQLTFEDTDEWPGFVRIRARQTDAAENLGESPWRVVIVNPDQPPSVTFRAVHNLAGSASRVQIAAGRAEIARGLDTTVEFSLADDVAVTSATVQFGEADEITCGDVEACAGFNSVVIPAPVEPLTVVLTARDGGAHSVERRLMIEPVATLPPIVELITPSDAAIREGARRVPIQFLVADDRGLAPNGVSAWFNGREIELSTPMSGLAFAGPAGEAARDRLPVGHRGAMTLFVGEVDLLPGEAILSDALDLLVEATDIEGLRSFVETSVRVLEDVSAPTIEYLAPDAHGHIEGTRLTVTLRVVDDVRLQLIEVSTGPELNALVPIRRIRVRDDDGEQTDVGHVYEFDVTITVPPHDPNNNDPNNANGFYVSASAVDVNGNQLAAVPLALVTELDKPPTLTFDELTPPMVVRGQEVPIVVHPEDEVGIAQVSVWAVAVSDGACAPALDACVADPDGCFHATNNLPPYAWFAAVDHGNEDEGMHDTLCVRAKALDARPRLPGVETGMAVADIEIAIHENGPPIVHLIAPDSAIVGRDFDVRVGAFDDFGIESVALVVSRGDAELHRFLAWSPPYTFTVPLPPGSPEGNLEIEAIATERQGDGQAAESTSVSKEIAVVVDNEVPTIEFVSPEANSAVEGTRIEVAVTARDNVGVAHVLFEVNGAPAGVVAAPPFRISVQVPILADGAFDLPIRAVAVDTNGNRTSIDRVINVTEDAAPSQPVLITPPHLVVGRSATLQVADGLTDDVGIWQVEFLAWRPSNDLDFDPAQVEPIVIGRRFLEPFATDVQLDAAWLDALAVDGNVPDEAIIHLAAVAVDTSRQRTRSALKAVTLKRPRPGEIEIVQPIAGSAVISGGQVDFVADIEPGAAPVAAVSVLVDGVEFAWIGHHSAVPGFPNRWITTFDLPAFPPDTQSVDLAALAFDEMGDALPVEVIELAVQADDEPPELSWIAPAEHEVVTRTERFSLQTGGLDGARIERVEFVEDGSLLGASAAARPLATGRTGFSFSWLAAAAAGRVVTLTAEAFDPSGNRAEARRQVEVGLAARAQYFPPRPQWIDHRWTGLTDRAADRDAWLGLTGGSVSWLQVHPLAAEPFGADTRVDVPAPTAYALLADGRAALGYPPDPWSDTPPQLDVFQVGSEGEAAVAQPPGDHLTDLQAPALAFAQIGNLLCVAEGAAGVEIYTLPAQGAPLLVQRIDTAAHDLAVFADRWLLVAGDGLRVFDANNGFTPGPTTFSLPGAADIGAIEVHGTLAAAAGAMPPEADGRYPRHAPVALLDLTQLPALVSVAEYDAVTARLDTGSSGVKRLAFTGTQLADVHTVFDQEGRPLKAIAALQRIERTPEGVALSGRLRANLAGARDLQWVDGQLVTINNGALVLLGTGRMELIDTAPLAEAQVSHTLERVTLRFSRNVFEPSLHDAGAPRVVLRRGHLMGEAIPLVLEVDGNSVHATPQAGLQPGERYWIQLAAGVTARCGLPDQPAACEDATSIAPGHLFGFEVFFDDRPIIDEVSPTSGNHGTLVRIEGARLAPGGVVDFGGAPAAIVGSDPDGRWLDVTAPALDPGPVNVRYTAPDEGPQASVVGAFTYTSQLIVHAVEPAAGQAGVANTVDIRGAGFGAEPAVSFGGEPANVTMVAPGLITVTTSVNHGPSIVPVTVTVGEGDDAVSVTLDEAYRFFSAAIDDTLARYVPLRGAPLARPADQLPRGLVGAITVDQGEPKRVWALSRAHIADAGNAAQLRRMEAGRNAAGAISLIKPKRAVEPGAIVDIAELPMPLDPVAITTQARGDTTWAWVLTKPKPLPHLPGVFGATHSALVVLERNGDEVQLIRSIERPGGGASLAVVDDLLFASAGELGLEVYAVVDPADPVLVHRISMDALPGTRVDEVFTQTDRLLIKTDAGSVSVRWPADAPVLADLAGDGALFGASANVIFRKAGNAVSRDRDAEPIALDHSTSQACATFAYGGLATHNGQPEAWISLVNATGDALVYEDMLRAGAPIQSVTCEGDVIAVSLGATGLSTARLAVPVVERVAPAGGLLQPGQQIRVYGDGLVDGDPAELAADLQISTTPAADVDFPVGGYITIDPIGGTWPENGTVELTLTSPTGVDFEYAWQVVDQPLPRVDRVEPNADNAGAYDVHGVALNAAGVSLSIGGIAVADLDGPAQTGTKRVVAPAAGATLPTGALTASALVDGEVVHQRLGAVVHLGALSMASVAPDRGPRTGGQTVSIRGQGFAADPAVTFDGVPAVRVRRIAIDELRVVVPARAAAGRVDVCVTQDGVSSCTGADGNANPPQGYLYQEAPLGRIGLGARIYDMLAVGELGVLALGEAGVQLVDLSGLYRVGPFAGTYIPPDRRRGLVDEDGDGVDDRVIGHLPLEGAVSLTWPRARFGGDRIYVGTLEGTLSSVDIGAPAQPRVIDTQRLGASPVAALDAEDSELAAAASAAGVRHFDINNAAAPPFEVARVLGQVDAQAIAFVDQHTIVGTGTRDDSWHVTDGTLHLPGHSLPLDVHRIRAWRGEAVVAAGADGLRRIAMDATQITYDLGGAIARDVDVQGNLAYVATDASGVLVVDLTAAPDAGPVRSIGSSAGEAATTVIVAGGRIIVGTDAIHGAGLDYGSDEGLRLVASSVDQGEVVAADLGRVELVFSRAITPNQAVVTVQHDNGAVAHQVEYPEDDPRSIIITFDGALLPGEHALSVTGAQPLIGDGAAVDVDLSFTVTNDADVAPRLFGSTGRYGWTNTANQQVEVAGAGLNYANTTFHVGGALAAAEIEPDGRSAVLTLAVRGEAGIVDITVTRNEYSDRLRGAYVFLDEPAVTDSWPKFFKPEGGTRLTMRGTGLLPPWLGRVELTIGDTDHQVTVNSAFEATARVKPGLGDAQAELRVTLTGGVATAAALPGPEEPEEGEAAHKYGLPTAAVASTAHVHPTGLAARGNLIWVAAGSRLEGNAFDQIVQGEAFPASIRVATAQRIFDEGDDEGALRFGGLLADSQLDDEIFVRWQALRAFAFAPEDASDEARASSVQFAQLDEAIDVQPDAFDVLVDGTDALIASGGAGLRVVQSTDGGLRTGHFVRLGDTHTARLVRDGELTIALSTRLHGYSPPACPPVETRGGTLTWLDWRRHSLQSADPVVLRTVSLEIPKGEPSVGPVAAARSGAGVLVVQARREGLQDCGGWPLLAPSLHPTLVHQAQTRLSWVRDTGEIATRELDDVRLVDVAVLADGTELLLSAERLQAFNSGALAGFVTSGAFPQPEHAVELNDRLAEHLGAAQRLDVFEPLAVISAGDGSAVIIDLDNFNVISAGSAPHARAAALSGNDLILAGTDRISAIDLSAFALPQPQQEVDVLEAISSTDAPALLLSGVAANEAVTLLGAAPDAPGPADLVLEDAQANQQLWTAAAALPGAHDLQVGATRLRGAAIVLASLGPIEPSPPNGPIAGGFHVRLTAATPVFAPGMRVVIGEGDDEVEAPQVDVQTLEALRFTAPASPSGAPGAFAVRIGFGDDLVEIGTLDYDLTSSLRMDLPGYPPALISDLARRSAPGEALLFVTIAEKPVRGWAGRTPTRGLEIFNVGAPEVPILWGRLPSGDRPARGLVLSSDGAAAWIAMGADAQSDESIEIVDVTEATTPYGTGALGLPVAHQAESIRRWAVDGTDTLIMGLSTADGLTAGGIGHQAVADQGDLDAGDVWPLIDDDGAPLDAFAIAPYGDRVAVLTGRRDNETVERFALRIYTQGADGLDWSATVGASADVSLRTARRAKVTVTGSRLYLGIDQRLEAYNIGGDGLPGAEPASIRHFPGVVTAVYSEGGEPVVAFDGPFGIETVAAGAFVLTDMPAAVGADQPIVLRFSEPIQTVGVDEEDLIAAALEADAIEVTYVVEGEIVPIDITAEVQQQIGGAVLRITPVAGAPWPDAQLSLTLDGGEGCADCLRSMSGRHLPNAESWPIDVGLASPDFELITAVITSTANTEICVAVGDLATPQLRVWGIAEVALGPEADGARCATIDASGLQPGAIPVQVRSGDAAPGPYSAPKMLLTRAVLQLADLTPDQGPISGGTPVTLSGAGFHPGLAATFESGVQSVAVDLAPGLAGQATAVSPPWPIAEGVSVRVAAAPAPQPFTYNNDAAAAGHPPVRSILVSGDRSRAFVVSGGRPSPADPRVAGLRLHKIAITDLVQEGADLFDVASSWPANSALVGPPSALQRAAGYVIAAELGVAVHGWPEAEDPAQPAWSLPGEPTAIAARDGLLVVADRCDGEACLNTWRLRPGLPPSLANSESIFGATAIDALLLEGDTLWVTARFGDELFVEERDVRNANLMIRRGFSVEDGQETRVMAVSGAQAVADLMQPQNPDRIAPSYLLLGAADAPQIIRFDLTEDPPTHQIIDLSAGSVWQLQPVGNLVHAALGTGDLQTLRFPPEGGVEIEREDQFGAIRAFAFGLTGRLIGSLLLNERGAIGEPPGAGRLEGSLQIRSTALIPIALHPSQQTRIPPRGTLRIESNGWPGDSADGPAPATLRTPDWSASMRPAPDGLIPGASLDYQDALDTTLTLSLSGDWRSVRRGPSGIALEASWLTGDRFGELRPVIIGPTQAEAFVDEPIHIDGRDFDHVSAVEVGGAPAQFVMVNPQRLQITPIQPDRAAAIVVHTTGGLTARALGALRVVGAPSNLEISPAAAPIAAVITLTGDELTARTEIWIEGEQLAVANPIEGQLTFSAPAKPGVWDVEVRNGGLSDWIQLEILLPQLASHPDLATLVDAESTQLAAVGQRLFFIAGGHIVRVDADDPQAPPVTTPVAGVTVLAAAAAGVYTLGGAGVHYWDGQNDNNAVERQGANLGWSHMVPVDDQVALVRSAAGNVHTVDWLGAVGQQPTFGLTSINGALTAATRLQDKLILAADSNGFTPPTGGTALWATVDTDGTINHVDGPLIDHASHSITDKPLGWSSAHFRAHQLGFSEGDVAADATLNTGGPVRAAASLGTWFAVGWRSIGDPPMSMLEIFVPPPNPTDPFDTYRADLPTDATIRAVHLGEGWLAVLTDADLILFDTSSLPGQGGQ